MTKYSRTFAMPNGCTFSIPQIEGFISRHTAGADVIVDPFARNSRVGTITNDLNPSTDADYNMTAIDFLGMLVHDGIKADAVLYDPPYSPRQVKECYQGIGREVTQQDTQASFYREAKRLIRALVNPGGIVLSFGWSSSGMGKTFEHLEVLLVHHGGAHNDTICVAQQAPCSLFI